MDFLLVREFLPLPSKVVRYPAHAVVDALGQFPARHNAGAAVEAKPAVPVAVLEAAFGEAVRLLTVERRKDLREVGQVDVDVVAENNKPLFLRMRVEHHLKPDEALVQRAEEIIGPGMCAVQIRQAAFRLVLVSEEHHVGSAMPAVQDPAQARGRLHRMPNANDEVFSGRGKRAGPLNAGFVKVRTSGRDNLHRYGAALMDGSDAPRLICSCGWAMMRARAHCGGWCCFHLRSRGRIRAVARRS